MCVACFNIRGTLVHHETKKLVPLMPQLLRRLHEAGWRVRVTTRYEADSARELLLPLYRAADIAPEDVGIAAKLADKAAYVCHQLADGVAKLVFVDDNPAQVKAVMEATQDPGDRPRHAVVRVFGFLGSRKSARETYSQCVASGAEYALTALDLAEQLESWFSYEAALPTLAIDDIIELVPGLTHPMSAAGGESQLVPGRIFAQWSQLSLDQLARAWMNVGLVQCDECIFCCMARMALAECGSPEFAAYLEGVHDAGQYVRALKAAPPQLLREVGQSLAKGLDLMTHGAESVGADRSDEVAGRLARSRHRVQELLGSV